MRNTLVGIAVMSLLLCGCTQRVYPNVGAPTPQPSQTPNATQVPPALPSPSPSVRPSATPKPTKTTASLLIKQLPSTFMSDTTRDVNTIDTIVIHSHYNPTAKDPFSITSSKAVLDQEQVSAHYDIDRTGTVWQLVPENRLAWHAGVSQMPAPDNRTAVNYFSIGIELIGNKTSGFTPAQYHSLELLVADIVKRLPIKYVVGHSTISPGRKTDPWMFDWTTFHQQLKTMISKPVQVIGQ